MNDLIKQEILEDINKADQELVKIIGAKDILSKVVAVIVNGARKCVHDANSSASVDDRIKILVTGIQEIVTYIEKEAEKNGEQIDRLQNRISVLKEVTVKIDKLVEDEKKMEEAKCEETPKV